MNQLFTKRMKALAFFGTISILSLTLVAKPALKKIKAYVNPTITYTLNGEKVLTDTKTITYDNKTYVPLADVAKLMGLQTKFENNTVIMTKTTTPAIVVTPEVKPPTTTGAFVVTPETTETVEIAKAIIKEAKVESKTVTIYKAGDADKIENYTILNISDATKILHESDTKVYTLADLKAGMEVSVKHSKVTTSSLPPQTAAFEIKILAQKGDEDKDDEKEEITLTGVKILEVSNSGKYITVEGGTEEGGQIKITFDNKTKVKYEGAKKQPNANALKVGQIVNVKLERSKTAATSSDAKILEITVKGE
jgi:hypothetical protein